MKDYLQIITVPAKSGIGRKEMFFSSQNFSRVVGGGT